MNELRKKFKGSNLKSLDLTRKKTKKKGRIHFARGKERIIKYNIFVITEIRMCENNAEYIEINIENA